MQIVPQALSDAYGAFTTTNKTERNTLWIRVAVAAVIYFSIDQGYSLVAALAATYSLPATTLAAAALCLTHGYTALKVGLAAKNIFNLALGAALSYKSWYLAHHYKAFQGIGEQNNFFSIQTIAGKVFN